MNKPLSNEITPTKPPMKTKEAFFNVVKKFLIGFIVVGLFGILLYVGNSAPSDSIIIVNNTDPRLSQFNFDMLICADNNTINYLPNENITIKVNDTTTLNIVGKYKESKGTSELLPKCVNTIDGKVFGNASCITEKCSKIIMFNVLNGEVKTVWLKGQVW